MSIRPAERIGIMKMHNEKGRIRMTNEVFTNITGAVATSCYGVIKTSVSPNWAMISSSS